jgi:hypothetical protein
VFGVQLSEDRMKCPALVFVGWVLALTPAFAQQQGSITGIVRDVSGKALPGVTVGVTAQVPGIEGHVTVTDAQGRYSTGNLPSGIYTLQFSLPGFSPVSRDEIGVTGPLPTALDVVMRVAGLNETLQVAPPFRIRPRFRPDVRPECLHGPNETPAEAQRRIDALNAMRLIYGLLDKVPVSMFGYPSWETLARSKAVADLKNAPGPAGDLAKTIEWGSSEPLPGWRLSYEAALTSVVFALTDATDPCGFTYSSRDAVVMPPTARVLPLAPD